MSHVMCHMLCVTCYVSHVMCHMLYVTCYVSHVMCHMLCVPCYVSHVNKIYGDCYISELFFFLHSVEGLSGITSFLALISTILNVMQTLNCEVLLY
jgi:hypothetical protein